MLQEAIKYNLEKQGEIHSICAPLENLFGINLLQYRRFYLKGGLICLINHPEWMKVSFDNNYWHSTVFKSKIQNLEQKNTLHYLWPLYPISNDPIYMGLYEHNIWNGITIYKKHLDYIETYAFAGSRENIGIRDVYVYELDTLEHFISYFRSKITSLVSPFEKDILISHDLNLYTPEDGKENKIREQFLKETSITDFYIRANGTNVKLTKRETECLDLLMSNKKIKEVAFNLGLSTRTVESHLENARLKANCKTTSQLINMYKDS